MDESASYERGRTDGVGELRLRLPLARAEYLRGAVENPALGPGEAALALRNRALPATALQKIARDRRWLRTYDVRLGLARHPRSSQALARGILGDLHWRDLADLAAEARIAPAVRRDAERILCARLAELSVGERVALARRAGPGVIGALREHREVAVLRALFGNPRFLELDAVAVASAGETPPQNLAALADHRGWSARPAVGMALLANPATPIPASLRLVEKLPLGDLARVADDGTMPRIVQVAAERRLDRRRGPGAGPGFG